MASAAKHARGVVVLQVLVLLAACGRPPAPEGTSVSVDGAAVYEMACAMCHLDGSALWPNPALTGSAVVNGSKRGLIEVILNGQNGKSVIDGEVAGGIMPGLDYLSDAEVAAVANYVRTRFGNGGPSVTIEDVRAVRP